jgi:hypothetical protein
MWYVLLILSHFIVGSRSLPFSAAKLQRSTSGLQSLHSKRRREYDDYSTNTTTHPNHSFPVECPSRIHRARLLRECTALTTLLRIRTFPAAGAQALSLRLSHASLSL